MQTTRRILLSVVAATPFAMPFAAPAQDDKRLGERFIGKPDAKVTIEEYFSLTCGHCANFALNTLPRVKTELIETGKCRLVFRDFPLDQIALTAAAVARAMPPERYEPFLHALFASQDRWAFARGVNHTEEIWKFAALAGLKRTAFDAAVADTALRTAILQAQEAASKQFGIRSTPSFVIKGQTHAGALSFERFRDLVEAAS